MEVTVYKDKNIAIVLLLVLCVSIVMPIPAYASPQADSSSSTGLINTIVDLLASIFHIDLKQPNIPSTTHPIPSQSKGTGSKDILGFYAEWYGDDTSSYDDLTKHVDSIGTIAPFWSTLHGDGSVTDRGGNNHPAVMNYAHNNKVTTLLMVNNAKQNDPNAGIHEVLANPSLRKIAIDNLDANIKKYGLDGINIDFEMVPASDRDNVTAFMRELSARLKPEGLLVTIDVLPKHNEDNDVAAAYDYAKLAQYSDKIILMTYDYHAGWNNSGPVAGINSVDNDLKYALSLIPKNKIYLGVASYGYDWSSKGTESLEFGEIQKVINRYGLKVQWDETSKSPHFSYTGADGVDHQVWYENSQSLQYKINLVNNYDIAGIALWKLGDEDPLSWQVIQNSLKQ
jgi:spore germination protein